MRIQTGMIASVVMLMMGCGLFNETMPGPGVGPNTSVGGLHIDATLGIYLAEYPRATDGPVSGLGIKITEKDPTTDAMLDVSKNAVLKVNGVTVPYISDGFSTDFRLEKVVIPNAEPGSTLTISATHGAGSATFQIPCPDTILTAPTENVKCDRWSRFGGKLDWQASLHFHLYLCPSAVTQRLWCCDQFHRQ